MLLEDTLRSSTQYLTAVRREETAEHWCKTFHGLVLRGKLRTTVRWITERKKGGVLLPEEQCTKTGERVLEVLHAKHPDARPPSAATEGSPFSGDTFSVSKSSRRFSIRCRMSRDAVTWRALWSVTV